MQSDYNQIYKLTAERTGESEQLYKDIGNIVFSNLNKLLRRPPSLILKLKGVGSWYLRKRRMEIMRDLFPPNFNQTQEDFSSRVGLLRHENKVEVYHIFIARLKDYEAYISLRDSIREKRHETQALIEPKDDNE